ncbi:claspin-like [Physella acuta]|uniref:claspin-like n=1 Tax=Physella acuta TaxID=109671 RepID=UPI0027DBCDB5|nr:claspin-like [Physella acuta]
MIAEDLFSDHTNQVSTGKADPEEETNKSDSGMEESFNQSKVVSDEEDDAATVSVSAGSKVRRRRMILDDDEDDESHEDVKNDGDTSHEVGSDNADNDQETVPPLTFPSDDDDQDDDTPKLLIDWKENKELFDAESDDDDRPRLEDDAVRPGSDEDASNEEGNEDEGFDESQINAGVLAKLKKLKGASKSKKERVKYSRKAKPSAEKMLEIYSDSQRMLRESRVNLPYYEPETKTLNDFLARASQKRQEYAGLKRAKDIVKAHVIQEKLSIPRLPTPPRKMKYQAKADQVATHSCPDDSGIASQGQTTTATLEGGDLKTVSPEVVEESDALPDIVPARLNLPIDTTPEVPANTDHTSAGQCDLTSAGQLDLSHRNVESPTQEIPDSSHKDVTSSEHLSVPSSDHFSVPSLSKDPSRDLFLSQSVSGSAHQSTETDQCGGHDLTPDKTITAAGSLGQAAVDTTAPANKLLDAVGGLDKASDGSPALKKPPKPSLLEQLETLNLPALPRITGSPNGIICLDEPEAASKNPDLVKFMHKFAEHARPRKHKAGHDVNLSLVEKEGESGEHQKLKLKTLTYHVESDEDILQEETPGARLVKLKQELSAGMKKKREEARQRRLQLYALENEEGFEGEKQEEEEEEEELSESSSESSEEEVEKLINGVEEDSDDERDYNPLLDTEAVDDSDGDDKNDDSDGDDNDEDSEDNVSEIHLHFDASDNEEQAEDSDNEDILLSSRKKNKSQIVESDDEDVGGDKSDNEDDGKEKPADREDIDKDPLINFLSSGKAGNKLDDHDEDKREFLRSPDLYTSEVSQISTVVEHVESSQMSTVLDPVDSSQSVPCSPLIDCDGFIKRSQAPVVKSSLLPFESASSFSNLDALADQCSLPFTAGNIFKGLMSQDLSKNTAGSQSVGGDLYQSMGGDLKDEGDSNMSEIIGLCSGSFGAGPDKSVTPNKYNQLSLRSQVKQAAYQSDDVYDPFSILSVEESVNKSPRKFSRIKKVLSDSEDDTSEVGDREADTDVEEGGDSDDSSKPVTFTSFKDKKRRIRQEFVEDEAELSGSECESDEDLDLAEEDDILEEEEGDKEMAGVSEEKLREQVGRVHMKQLQDDDDRQVLLYKEMYLQDGDLYSEGGGRMRNFRWKNADHQSQQDLFANISDDDQVDEDADEIKWRKDRYEREKFLAEAEPNPSSEDSQLVKLGHVYLKRRESFTAPIKTNATKEKMLPPEPPKAKLTKKGSFLSRKEDTLVKLTTPSTLLTGRSSKNFIFQSIDPEAQDSTVNSSSHPPKRKAHSCTEQAAKKAKLCATPPVKRQDSIFNLLD